MNLTFCMLLNIQSFTVLGSYLYCINGGLEPRLENICSRNLKRFKRKLSVD